MPLVFDQDPEKEAINIQRHGISFSTAQEVFDDPNQVIMENYWFTEEGEQRLQIIGVTRGLVLLLVVFVDRSDAENEVIRIISARKADKFEEKIYAAHITNQNY